MGFRGIQIFWTGFASWWSTQQLNGIPVNDKTQPQPPLPHRRASWEKVRLFLGGASLAMELPTHISPVWVKLKAAWGRVWLVGWGMLQHRGMGRLCPKLHYSTEEGKRRSSSKWMAQTICPVSTAANTNSSAYCIMLGLEHFLDAQVPVYLKEDC